jgi:hypothetical protein
MSCKPPPEPGDEHRSLTAAALTALSAVGGGVAGAAGGDLYGKAKGALGSKPPKKNG